MSELTKCNYCSLQAMRRDADEQTGKITVVLEKRDKFGMIPARYSNKKTPSAWFMALTNHCVC